MSREPEHSIRFVLHDDEWDVLDELFDPALRLRSKFGTGVRSGSGGDWDYLLFFKCTKARARRLEPQIAAILNRPYVLSLGPVEVDFA